MVGRGRKDMRSIGLLVLVLLSGCVAGPVPAQEDGKIMGNISAIRYVALGDSYTKGEGVRPEQSWPAQLVEWLASKGIAVTLLANPAESGWTAQQAIEAELPLLEKLRPDVATVQIGANDWVQGADETVFRLRLRLLLQRMEGVVGKRIVVVTVPDFSVAPFGALFAGGRNISAGLEAFNRIIREEAAALGLPVADVFAISQKSGREWFAKDGLHPSAAQYAAWVEVIAPVAKSVLEKREE